MKKLTEIKLDYDAIMHTFNDSQFIEDNKEMNPNVYFEPFSIYDKQQKSYTTASLNFM